MTDGTHGMDAIGGAARDWIVRLSSGEMSDAEMRRLRRWLAESGAHRAAFEKERCFWRALEDLRGDFVPASSLVGEVPRRRRRHIAVMGGALAACIALLVAWPELGIAFRADFRSSVGEQRSVSLADGSVVHLNTDTAIGVDFAAAERRVVLLRGEALFEVKPDPGRPFRVIAVDGATRAVGTVFDVRVADERAHVLVTEGQVAVSSPAAEGLSVDVRAGEETSYRRGRAPRPVTPAAQDGPLPWLRGKIVIEAMPLSAALAELDRYRGGRIVLLGGDGARPVSGVFDVRHVDEAIKALAATQGLKAIAVTPYLTLLH
jgi:transmembrane sensor